VAHNPESNMNLASGTAPVLAYLRAGVSVGLGTDGAASNNDLDMFDAMRVAALLHKHAAADPSALTAKTVVELATIRGAHALGMGGRIGSLEPGKRADLVTVSLARARLTPVYDPISHLVYAAHGDDVQNSIVNGRVLMRNRKVLTMNEAAVLADAQSWGEKVKAAVKPTNGGR
jgi:5-methylthioadenosine/S-adenosylhomocysteine deaminase